MRAILAVLLTSSAAFAEESTIRMIDARDLSVEELIAMAAAERENAGAYSCCDWGGMGCRVETVAWMKERQSQPAAPAMPLIAGVAAPE